MAQPLEKVKSIRKGKGYSQEYMSFILKIDPSTYGKLERGDILITAERLEDIAEILNIPVMEIFPFKQK